MGVVYRARERELDRIVALKMIRSNRLTTTNAVDRFIAEARIAAQAKHAVVDHRVGARLDA
jgi:eukaryotic-like serine/threonine-protein kinase